MTPLPQCEPYVLGPISDCNDLSEDGDPLWQAEVQTMGGYGVAATIYAGTEDAARQMAEQAIAAWNARAIEATRPPIVTDKAVEREPTQFGDNVAERMRVYFEAHLRAKVSDLERQLAEARAAIAAKPAIPPQSLGDHALPPSGLSQSSLSQAKPAAAIAKEGKA